MATTSRTTPTSKAKKPTVHFSVAAAEKELDLEEIEPFTVEHPAGNVVEFADPRKIGYIQAAGMDLRQPVILFRDLIEDVEGYRLFVSEDIPQTVAKDMLMAWREHYGMLDAGN